MIDKKKLDEIFGRLVLKTENCKNIQELKEISNSFVQEALDCHWEIIKNNPYAKAKLITEILERLKMCIPRNIPYYPAIAYNPKTDQLTFCFIRNGAKISISKEVASRVH